MGAPAYIMNLLRPNGQKPTGRKVCAYMYTVTLEFPVASEWVRIYMYAMTHYKGDMTPKDIRQDELSDHEMSMLTDFRRWIYERRVKERKRKQHAEKLKPLRGERRRRKGELGNQTRWPSPLSLKRDMSPWG